MSRIVKLERAKADIDEIWDYIADDSEDRAKAFVKTIDKKLRTIAGRPNIGRARDELEEGIRSFPIGKYIVFYRPLPDGIEVIRVLHSARDLDAVFDESE